MRDEWKQVTMLIVEDEDFERKILAEYMDWGMLHIDIVGQAQNGRQGLEMCVELKPDIVLTDVKMHSMDGLTMAQNIRRLLPDTKIIFLSSYDDFEYAQEAISLDAVEYLTKPLDKMKLLKSVKKASDQIQDHKMQKKMSLMLEMNYNKSKELAKSYLLQKLLNGTLHDHSEEVPLFYSMDIDWLLQMNHWYELISISFKDLVSQECINAFKKLILQENVRGEIAAVSNQCIVIILALAEDSKNSYRDLLIHRSGYDTIIKSNSIIQFVTKITEFHDAYMNLLSDHLTGPQEIIETQTKNSSKQACIDRVKQIVENEYGTYLSLTDLAQRIHFTPNYLGTVFKSYTGETFHHYLMRVRINKAKKMLRQESISIQKIAEKCGYENVTYFHVQFKKETGRTPSEFREMDDKEE